MVGGVERARPTGGDLFIVDNSVSGWTGLEYLRQWSDLAESFDIATGFCEIGALLALDGKWQQLRGIRLLMGDEVSLRTKAAFREALRRRVVRLDVSLEREKAENPFLEGVEAVTDAVAQGRIECRVYRRDKFHAKAYITHAKFDVVGAQALVGSSNFTRAGLTRNVELNIQVRSGREVAQLQDWFDAHWDEADDVTEDVLRTISRHVVKPSPFEVYAKALHELFRGGELTAGEWDVSRSRMFGCLDRYQQEAYWSLMKIARRHGGAFLCDGVGLGKTFVGLMLIERLVLRENKRVVLLAPKAAREGVWEPHLRRWLPHIGGVGGGEDFSSLSVFSHTDLSRSGDFPERFQRIAELADVVIIDEAHHFRNRGSRGERTPGGDTGSAAAANTPRAANTGSAAAANTGSPTVMCSSAGAGRALVRLLTEIGGRGSGSGPVADGDRRDQRSRYWRLYDMLDGSARPKLVFLLTATPVNNRLADFRHMAELFTRGDEAFFARSLGVHNLSDHFNVMERALRDSLAPRGKTTTERTGSASIGSASTRAASTRTTSTRAASTGSDSTGTTSTGATTTGSATTGSASTGATSTGSAFAEGMTPEARDALAADEVFAELVVQRSRSYAKKSQMQQRGESAVFPVRRPPVVAEYSIRRSYRDVLDMFEEAFARKQPLFSLAVYYPLAYYTGPGDVNPVEENRQRQVVGLVRTMLLKRFESSVYAFEKSLDRLMRKLLAFVEVHSQPGTERDRLDAWKRRNAAVLGFRPETQLGLNLDGEDPADAASTQDDADEDVIPAELLDAVAVLSRDDYDVAAVLDRTFEDLDEIARFLAAASRLNARHDDKARKLARLLRTKDLTGRKVLVFTEFADTARYVQAQLKAAGIAGVARIDSTSNVDRAEVIRRFSPYYNGSSTARLAAEGLDEIRVLVSTDVLSEGLNLQDATRLVNYDLHWNPVRMMQRIGRVDRRMDPEIEARLTADHPETATDRGVVRFWNFLPPEDLERILKLYERVTGKALLISHTLGIEGRNCCAPTTPTTRCGSSMPPTRAPEPLWRTCTCLNCAREFWSYLCKCVFLCFNMF